MQGSNHWTVELEDLARPSGHLPPPWHRFLRKGVEKNLDKARSYLKGTRNAKRGGEVQAGWEACYGLIDGYDGCLKQSYTTMADCGEVCRDWQTGIEEQAHFGRAGHEHVRGEPESCQLVALGSPVTGFN